MNRVLVSFSPADMTEPHPLNQAVIAQVLHVCAMGGCGVPPWIFTGHDIYCNLYTKPKRNQDD
jgi:hypothetical protein